MQGFNKTLSIRIYKRNRMNWSLICLNYFWLKDFNYGDFYTRHMNILNLDNLKKDK